MTKKSHTTHGKAIIDVKVAPPYKEATEKAGWYTQRIKQQHWETSDTQIAIDYGKGKHILITADKTAYDENVEGGFGGYIVLASIYYQLLVVKG